MTSNIRARQEALEEALSLISPLARYGANATFRRVRDVIASAAQSDGQGKFEILCGGGGRDDDGCRRCLTTEPAGALPFERVLNETQEDLSRRSVFLDPEESFVANLMDFLSGRISVLEFRNPGKRFDLAKLEAVAIQRLRGKVPSVTINLDLANSTEEIVHTLRHLANRLENTSLKREADNHIVAYEGDLATIQAACTFQGTQHIGSRWTQNGTVREYHYRDQYRCLPDDACCENQAYIEYRNDRWEVVWRDGDSSLPPPTPPGEMQDFVQSPWNNRIPLLTDPAIGTLTSDHGWRRLRQPDGTYIRDFHPGIDIGSPPDTNVQANHAGVVVGINSTGSSAHPEDRGVFIRDDNNIVRMYWHIDPSVTLAVDDRVEVGDRLGSTHDWARPHLHYVEYAPPNGDYTQRSDANSRNPLP